MADLPRIPQLGGLSEEPVSPPDLGNAPMIADQLSQQALQESLEIASQDPMLSKALQTSGGMPGMAPQPASKRPPMVKSMLRAFFEGASEAGMASLGVPLPIETQERLARIAEIKARTDLTKKHATDIPITLQTPQGPMQFSLPADKAATILRGMQTEESKRKDRDLKVAMQEDRQKFTAEQNELGRQAAMDRLRLGLEENVNEPELAVRAVKGDQVAVAALRRLNDARIERLFINSDLISGRMDKRFGQQLDMASRRANAEFLPAEQALQDIRRQFLKTLEASGMDRLREARILNALVQSKSALITRANGDRGALANQDIERNLLGLPQWFLSASGDPLDIQVGKLDAVQESLRSSKLKQIEAFSSSIQVPGGRGEAGNVGGKVKMQLPNDPRFGKDAGKTGWVKPERVQYYLDNGAKRID